MSNHAIDELLLDAIKKGHDTRAKLMAIDVIRHQTWAVVGPRLAVLCKRQAIVQTKAGWRISALQK